MKQDISVTSGLTIGLDLGDRWSDVCVLDPEGRVKARFRAGTTQRGLQKAFSRYRDARVVLEVGTHSPWVSRWLSSSGFEVIVANPRRVRLIAQSDEKSDRFDAEILARLGRVDPALLRPIQHREEQTQRDRALLTVRDGLVRSRSSLVSRARGIAKSLGQRLPRCETESFAKRMRREGLASFFPGMEELVAILGELTQRIRELDREIETLCAERYPETVLLRQVAGVGPITALSFVLTVEDPARFVRSRQVGAYVGLRPKKRQSGDRDPQLRISKAGDPFLRRMLVQAAHYILGPFGPDTALRRFGERLMARGGRAARKKATVAVARKLAVLLHRLWLTGEIYEPLRGVELDAAA